MISMKEGLFVSTQRLYSVIYTKTKYLDVLFVRKWWSERSTKRNDIYFFSSSNFNVIV